MDQEAYIAGHPLCCLVVWCCRVGTHCRQGHRQLLLLLWPLGAAVLAASRAAADWVASLVAPSPLQATRRWDGHGTSSRRGLRDGSALSPRGGAPSGRRTPPRVQAARPTALDASVADAAQGGVATTDDEVTAVSPADPISPRLWDVEADVGVAAAGAQRVGLADGRPPGRSRAHAAGHAAATPAGVTVVL